MSSSNDTSQGILRVLLLLILAVVVGWFVMKFVVNAQTSADAAKAEENRQKTLNDLRQKRGR